MASSSGEVRRRKNPSKPSDTSSYSLNNNEKGGNNNNTLLSIILNNSKLDEYAWFIIFLSALTYFIITRGGDSNRQGGLLSSFSKPYDVICNFVSVAADSIDSKASENENERLLRSIFYIANNDNDNTQKQQKDDDDQNISLLTLQPNRRLEVILSSPLDVIDEINFRSEECISNEEGNKPNEQSLPYLSHLSSTAWVHDEELGRGYLLIADVGRSGRLWRYEVGGGPITIGRSLHMERSGCRSGLWVDDYDGADGKKDDATISSSCPENLFGKSTYCKSSSSSSSQSITMPLLGSASLAVELTRNADRASAGQNIIVAEWGERRIIRVEGESGARTPLVTVVPIHQSRNGKTEHEQPRRRVLRPNHLMYTPFGDLLFSDNYDVSGSSSMEEDDSSNNSTTATSNHKVGVVYRKKEAVHIPAIPVEQSRAAHEWTSTTNDGDDFDSIDILFQTTGVIEGMALGLDYSTLFVVVTTETSTTDDSGWIKTVYKLSLGADDDIIEDGIDSTDGGDSGTTILYQMNSSTDCKVPVKPYKSTTTSGSKLSVDEKGTLYLIACSTSISLLSQEDGHVIGTLELDDHLQKRKPPSTTTESFTSVNFGEDGYLYITSPNELMRLNARVGGLSIPTNMVVPSRLKK